ncbi:serine O-acetyltransferase EpsC [Megalodesulfovibrio gigas]|uniref:serine O-acetyltransferase n=1 Tax=Megalodesulfovibrio gigas (strain ATCC 19364 / DSM 1382 / NCIMB 9332 / VKM B-1759) TaxID=1121448 RepID=T2G948_MEGG1|nr:serine O-acetyltransferase EpsC [Megalodesulfovibrio gigas]AGW12641.1 putative Serine O-acetyltransferase [Megalodesulfovibrio gigas DSM 1382 = ATCC 19364]
MSRLLTLDEITEQLCRAESYEDVFHHSLHNQPMPSVEVLREVVARLQAILFPGYFGDSEIAPETMRFHVGAGLDVVARLLTEQIRRGRCFFCRHNDVPHEEPDCDACEDAARRTTGLFLSSLPEIRRLLAVDVRAAYVGDPAARHPGETIFCYPSILALTHHRIAHALHQQDVELIPRIIAEMAHSKTGIDIHPGAQIGEGLFIDHGTGVVVGETCIIGANVRIYQGVTLGAKSFPKDANGALIKGIARHPIVEDEVVIYAGATLLGRITIGKGSVVGGNVWLTEDLPPGSHVVQQRAGETSSRILLGNGRA